MLTPLTSDMFVLLIGQTFRVVREQLTIIPIELAAVTIRPLASDADRQPFTLLFHGPTDQPFGQGTYRVEHDQLGVIDGLFLTAHGPGAGGLEYAAVFN